MQHRITQEDKMDKYFIAIQESDEYKPVVAIYMIPDFENWKNDPYISATSVQVYFDLYETFHEVLDDIPVPSEYEAFDSFNEAQKGLIKVGFLAGFPS